MCTMIWRGNLMVHCSFKQQLACRSTQQEQMQPSMPELPCASKRTRE